MDAVACGRGNFSLRPRRHLARDGILASQSYLIVPRADKYSLNGMIFERRRIYIHMSFFHGFPRESTLLRTEYESCSIKLMLTFSKLPRSFPHVSE